MVNSRQALVTATASGSPGFRVAPSPRFTLTRHPFSRSYGANLPSSLARVNPLPLAFSARPPVSVCGTVTYGLKRHARLFLAVWRQHRWSPKGPPPHGSASGGGFAYLRHRPNRLEGHATCPRRLASCVPPRASPIDGAGMLTRFPSATPFGFTLGYRLTLGGRTFPRYPWAYGGRDSHPPFAYSCPHSHFRLVQRPSRVRLHPTAERSPTANTLRC